jgi:hypothetical protein
VPDARKRKIFFWLVWLLPFVGALYVYRRLAPDWFTPDRDSGDSQSFISSGLLGLESIFNPGARNINEANKKAAITIKAEGEMYDRQLPDFVDVEPAPKQVNEAGEKSE